MSTLNYIAIGLSVASVLVSLAFAWDNYRIMKRIKRLG